MLNQLIPTSFKTLPGLILNKELQVVGGKRIRLGRYVPRASVVMVAFTEILVDAVDLLRKLVYAPRS